MSHYLVARDAPPKRRGKHTGSHEEHFPEAAVMLAFAVHLIECGALTIEIHPDGEHAKRHDIRGWLLSQGFSCDSEAERGCVGSYTKHSATMQVDMRAGRGDVVASINGCRVLAECKGGIVNTRHSGQLSRLRKGLCEAVGQLLSRARIAKERNVAVVPYTTTTRALAERMASRCPDAGIEIALVRADGAVVYATSGGSSE